MSRESVIIAVRNACVFLPADVEEQVIDAIAEIERMYRERDELRAADADDPARMDAIEKLVQEYGCLHIHNGDISGPHYIGIGLANTGRTLRQAMDSVRNAAREKGDG